MLVSSVVGEGGNDYRCFVVVVVFVVLVGS